MTDLDLLVTPTTASLLLLLRQLEGRFRRAVLSPAPATRAPSGVDAWGGVLTHCGRRPLVVPLHEIREILNFPLRVTPIPLTRNWVLGIANNRGSLLPLYDLQQLLFGVPLERDERTRVLVVGQGQVAVGLVVESSVGMLHLSKGDLAEAGMPEQDALSPFVAMHAMVDGESVPILNVQELLSAKEFQEVMV